MFSLVLVSKGTPFDTRGTSTFENILEMRVLLMKKSVIVPVLFSLFSLFTLTSCVSGSGPSNSDVLPAPPPPINTGIVVDYDSNLFMNIYDIRLSVDDSILGTQTQGEKKSMNCF